MKKFTRFLWVWLTLCLCVSIMGCSQGTPDTTTAPPPTNEVQVVILLGQSNAEGFSYCQYLSQSLGQEAYARYNQGFADVKMSFLTSATTYETYDSGGEFLPVKLGQGTGPDRFGPEVGMAEKISEAKLRKSVYIIKCTYGGTTLYYDWRSPSSGKSGELYDCAVEYILQQLQKLQGMGLTPVVKAFCWMQGETDSCSPACADKYGDLTVQLVTDLRNAVAAYRPAQGEIGFLDAGISDSPLWTGHQTVNDAKKAAAAQDEFHHYIDTQAAGLRYDSEPAGEADVAHYDSESEIRLGHLFAELLLETYLEH